jgi:hypothetical protein
MLQRQPRVGDIVEDYCPRERRLSDHAVVAMVGDDVRQTRCTACDAEHEYKQGKVPPGRKKTAGPLAPKPPSAVASIAAPKPPDSGIEFEIAAVDVQAASDEAGPDYEPAPDAAPPAAALPPAPEGSVHRRLIRAVLPRVEGETPTRQAPEFTMHNAGQRPAAHGRPQRPGQGSQPRHGGSPSASHTRYPGSRESSGSHAGARGARGGQSGHGVGGHGPHQAHGQIRRNGPQHGNGPGPRKRH